MSVASHHFPALGPLCCDECAAARRPAAWTAEQVRDAWWLYRSGVPLPEIADAIGVGLSRVQALLLVAA